MQLFVIFHLTLSFKFDRQQTEVRVPVSLWQRNTVAEQEISIGWRYSRDQKPCWR